MTKDELIKAARDMPVQPGMGEALGKLQRALAAASNYQENAQALEQWCPPSRPAPKARVTPLPPRAAACGLVMDGDRIDLHQQQCLSCKSGTQAASYSGIDRSFPVDPLGLGRTCGHGARLQRDCKRCMDALPDMPDLVHPPHEMFVHPDTYKAIAGELGISGTCCPVAYGGRRGHSDWCRNNPTAKKVCKTCGATWERHKQAPLLDHDFGQPHHPPTPAPKPCDGSCLKPTGQPGCYTMCTACGEKLQASAFNKPVHWCCREAAASGGRSHSGGCAPNNAALAALIPPPAPSLAEKLAALPHLSGCDCARCKVGRAAACCNIGWHRSCEGRMCPFHTVAVAAAPLILLSEWDLLPDG